MVVKGADRTVNSSLVSCLALACSRDPSLTYSSHVLLLGEKRKGLPFPPLLLTLSGCYSREDWGHGSAQSVLSQLVAFQTTAPIIPQPAVLAALEQWSPTWWPLDVLDYNSHNPTASFAGCGIVGVVVQHIQRPPGWGPLL